MCLYDLWNLYLWTSGISVICIDRNKKHPTFLRATPISNSLNVLSGPKYIVHKGSTIITAAW